MTFRHFSGGMVRVSPQIAMPATWWTSSGTPCSAVTRCAQSSTAARSVTSRPVASRISAPARRASATVRSRPSGATSESISATPSRARLSASSRPMPEAAPVTSAEWVAVGRTAVAWVMGVLLSVRTR